MFTVVGVGDELELLVPYEDDDGEEDNEAEFSRSRFVALLFVF